MTPSRLTVPVFSAAACVVIAALSVLGWLTGNDTLTSAQPGLSSMVPMTAALMVAGSGALLLVLAAVLLLLFHSLIHSHGHLPALAWIDLRKLSSPVTASMFLMTGASLLCGGLSRRVQAGQWLALIAHELRNPLAPIGAAADLLRMQGAPDPAQVRRASEVIGRQVANMTHLIEDLLDLSRVSRGLLALDSEPVDLHAAVCEAVEQVKPQVERRRHLLDTELGQLHPIVSDDHKRLVQVVANLLGNAAKYTPEGGRIQVALRLYAEQGEAEVRVEDDGIGIDAALLPHVFDSFTQDSRSAGRAEGGLGLGLALVKRLAALHGGSVAAFSAGPGQGSCFVLTLPYSAADSAAGSAA